MPVLGLGVWQMDEGAETENAVEWALEAGYRHIDTAQLYRNERSVGAAIRRSGIPREEIFVTTKWLPTARSAGSALEQSLERLGMSNVDLYLIHWPVPFRSGRGWRDMGRSPIAGSPALSASRTMATIASRALSRAHAASRP